MKIRYIQLKVLCFFEKCFLNHICTNIKAEWFKKIFQKDIFLFQFIKINKGAQNIVWSSMKNILKKTIEIVNEFQNDNINKNSEISS